MRRAVRPALVAFLLLFVAPPVEALTATSQFTMSATVFSGCSLTTSRLEIALARGQATPGLGRTSFIVTCPAASAANPLPIRFTFEPQGAGGQFILKDQVPWKSMPYQLCNDSACAEVYGAGVPGPVVAVDRPSFSYSLWGQAFPPASGVRPGNYRQRVTVTLTY